MFCRILIKLRDAESNTDNRLRYLRIIQFLPQVHFSASTYSCLVLHDMMKHDAADDDDDDDDDERVQRLWSDPGSR